MRKTIESRISALEALAPFVKSAEVLNRLAAVEDAAEDRQSEVVWQAKYDCLFDKMTSLEQRPTLPGTLLDWFAGQSLAGTTANKSTNRWISEELAVRAYDDATAMLAEKKRRESAA